MKTFSKKFLGLLMAICMMGSLCTHPALAVGSVGNDQPENCADAAGDEAISFTVESVVSDDAENPDEASPYAWYSGTRVLRITVSPLGKNLDTGEIISGKDANIYKRAIFNSSGQSESIKLTRSQTASLMEQMQNYLSSLPGNYALYGWNVTGTVSFDYYKIRYYTYRYATSSETSEDIRVNVNGGGRNCDFDHNFAYPAYVDIATSYYFSRVEGEVYFTNSNGTQSNAMFLLSANFNRSDS